MINLRRLLILFSMLMIAVHVNGQTASADKKVKKAEQKKEERVRNEQKSEIKGRKRHESIQDKKTRKRMKKHRKGRVHVESYERRPSFIKRWFHKKEH